MIRSFTKILPYFIVEKIVKSFGYEHFELQHSRGNSTVIPVFAWHIDEKNILCIVKKKFYEEQIEKHKKVIKDLEKRIVE